MRKQLLLGWFMTILTLSALSQALPLREQAKIINEILAERLKTLLPVLMEKSNIDCWVVMSREYNEDPVLRTMLPAEWLNARRRTIFVFYRNPSGGQLEKLAIARYNAGSEIKASWDVLIHLLTARDPQKIAVRMCRSMRMY